MTEDMYNTAGDKNPTSYAYDLTVTENNADIYSFYLTQRIKFDGVGELNTGDDNSNVIVSIPLTDK